jgi:hypothetical protein
MDSRAQVVSAICGFCAGPVLLVASWAGVLAQPEEYSFLHHASSDLGADTADAAWLSNQLGESARCASDRLRGRSWVRAWRSDLGPDRRRPHRGRGRGVLPDWVLHTRLS